MNQLSHAVATTFSAADYERDFALWIDKQLELLRAKDFEHLDLKNIVEEIGNMAASLKRELGSRLEVLILHLLKCQFQPERKSSGWLGTIGEQRSRVRRLLKDSPSLSRLVEEYACDCYLTAVKRASIDTGLAESAFPPALPYTLDELLEFDFIP